MYNKKINIVLATRNKGKIQELSKILVSHKLEVIGLESFPQLKDVEETGHTFEENALLKARYVSEKTGLIAIADDSGLQVDALNLNPGVYSARYANDYDLLDGETNDMRNNRKLLDELSGITFLKRSARFVCCIVACKPSGEYIVANGIWEGLILEQSQGEQGFGYDPIFFDPTIKLSAAQLSKVEKNSRSHRGKALQKLLTLWDNFYTSSV